MFSNALRGSVILDMFGENFPSWFTIPNSLLSSVILEGVFILTMVEIFSGSAHMPFLLTTWPRNLTSSFKNLHLLGLSITPAFCSLCITVSKRVSWFLRLATKTSTSSTRQSTPSNPFCKAFETTLMHLKYRKVIC